MKFGILRDKFKLKKFQSLYFAFEYWFRDIKGSIEGTHGIQADLDLHSPQNNSLVTNDRIKGQISVTQWLRLVMLESKLSSLSRCLSLFTDI